MSNTRKVTKALDERAKERAEARREALERQDPAEELVACLDILAETAEELALDDESQELHTALWQTVELGLMLLSEHSRLLAMLGQYQQLLGAFDEALKEEQAKVPAGLVLPGQEGFAV